MELILIFMICYTMYIFGRPVIFALANKKKELPTHDDKGVRTEYDAHYTRALEVEQGVPAELLTTCDSDNCSVCDGTLPLGSTNIKVDANGVVAHGEKIIEAASKLASETARNAALTDEEIRDAEERQRIVSWLEFYPDHMTPEAAINVTEENGKIVLEFTENGESYIRKLKGYKIVDGGLQKREKLFIDSFNAPKNMKEARTLANLYDLEITWTRTAVDRYGYNYNRIWCIWDSYGNETEFYREITY